LVLFSSAVLAFADPFDVGFQQYLDPTYYVTAAHENTECYAQVVFQGLTSLREAESVKAERELREPDYRYLPRVGYLYMEVVAPTMQRALFANSLFIIRDATGRELYRGSGSADRVPDYSRGASRIVWFSRDILILDDTTIEFPLRVRAILNHLYISDLLIQRSSASLKPLPPIINF
jgi:hypothetical protein